MGCYVNPKSTSKELWLELNGKFIEQHEAAISTTHLPVCLVDNGAFSAAGVAVNEGELRAFTREDDMRYKEWYLVPREKLREVSDLANWENR